MGSEGPAPGLVIGGKYRIERAIGAGAWAEVFLAEHCELRTKVAIKLLTNWQNASDKQTSRFLREARAAARLRSAHVCRVVDVGRTDAGAPFTVLEYLEGTDLQHVLSAHGRIDPGIAVDYVLQVCEGVAEAHAQGIVHRDLKPANLFLTTSIDGAPLVKILDFGISKETRARQIELGLTRSTDILGTPYYMSPEQLRDATEVDPRTDIWSIGVILWRMITGHMPFEAPSFAELCVSIMMRPPAVPEQEIPPGLADVLAVCLEKDPAHRYQDVRDLAAALSRWRSGEECTRVSRIGRVLARLSGGEDTADESLDRPHRLGTGDEETLQSATGEPTFPNHLTPSLAAVAVADDSLPAPSPRTGRTSRLALIGAAAAALVIASVVAITLQRTEPSSDRRPAGSQTTAPVPEASAAMPEPVSAAAPEPSPVAPEPSAPTAPAASSPAEADPEPGAPAAAPPGRSKASERPTRPRRKRAPATRSTPSAPVGPDDAELYDNRR